MKVNGTGQPPTPGASGAEPVDKAVKRDETGPTRDASPVDKSGPADKASFAEKLSGKRPTEGVTGSASASKIARKPAEASGVNEVRRANDVAVNDVAAELRAGKLSPQAAIDKVLERVINRQLGPDAPPAVRDRVRAALQDALETDPLLTEKLARLE